MRAIGSRRGFLLSLLGPAAYAASGKGQELVGDRQRFLDPTTEFEVVRLTSPEYESVLPANTGRAASRRGDYLLCGSDRGQGMQAYRIDFKTGKTRQMTEYADLEPETMTLAAADRWLYVIDGNRLLQVTTASLRDRVIAEMSGSAGRLSVSEDGLQAVYAEREGAKTRLRATGTARPAPVTVASFEGTLGEVAVRPRRTGLFYRRDEALWLASFDGKQNRPLQTAPGRVLAAQWAPDGSGLLYLVAPAGTGRLNELREIDPESGADVLVAKTSQYVAFAANGDATVFLGASGSKAQPTLLLMLRSVKRELTICEHKCSDARMANPTFAPNSQRIFFQTDRHGKRVIYGMAVDRLVELTELTG